MNESRSEPTGRRAPWRTWRDNQRGGTAIEYALIASLMAMVMITGLSQLGSSNSGSWNGTATTMAAAMK